MYRRILKQIVVFTAGCFAINTYAVAPGFYMGLMLGPATNNSGNQQAQTTFNTTTLATPKSNQFGTRAYMGYQLNHYAAFEGGIDYFTGVKYDTKNVPTCSSVQARVRGFDIVGKGSLPVYSFDIYGKAGVAFIYQTYSGALNPDTNNACGDSTHQTKFSPTVSIGGSYAFNQNWVTDISWNRIQVGGVIKSVDFFGLGISYHFVDKYCGQFLCED
jgi:opacity protein-like surface antigen